MKILLLGEYSGLHLNLRDGLNAIGHEAVLAASGDGWKKIPADIALGAEGAGIRNRIRRNLQPFLMLDKLTGYDVVQLISPIIFNFHFNINWYLLRRILENNKKSFLLAAGCDGAYAHNIANVTKYTPCEDCSSYDLPNGHCYWLDSNINTQEAALIRRVDGIIPGAYDYAMVYKDHPKLLSYIPFPINTDKIKYEETPIGGKLVLFHGLNREGFKGTRYVKEAFSILEKKYPNDVTCIIDGKMPLNQYLETMRQVNILVDQTSSYSTGINGLFALAMGKVVLGGGDEESNSFQYGEPSPIINITPSAESIVKAVEYVLANRKDLPEIGKRGREFVERHHNYISVAKKFASVYSESQ